MPRNATGRETQAFGTPVVVFAWESRVRGEGATLERGEDGYLLTKVSRVGVIELSVERDA